MFSIALLLFCFTISNSSTRISNGVMSAVIGALVVWCLRVQPAEESDDDEEMRQNRLLTLRARDRLFMLPRARDRLFVLLKNNVFIPLRSFFTRTPEEAHDAHAMADRQSGARSV